MFGWLLACAFHVPAPAAGAMVPLALVAPREDPRRPYTLLADRLWFVDTGATRTTCDDDFVAALGVPVLPTGARVRGEVGAVKLRRTVLHDVEVGGWVFARLPCAVRDLGSTSSLPEIPGDPVVGILGANLLRHFVVDLDRAGAALRLHADTAALPVALQRGVRLGREHGLGGRRVAPLEVDGARRTVVIDTGADRTYLRAGTGAVLARYAGERRGTGPGGARAVEVVIRSVETATLRGMPLPLRDYVVRRGSPGLLGMDALGAARVVIDMRRGRLARVEGVAPPFATVLEGRAEGRAEGR